MAPFRNLLGRKPVVNTVIEPSTTGNENPRPSTDSQRSGPLNFRRSRDEGPPEYKMSVDENEPFSISRESFDSYRRSFDISARSPVSQIDQLPSRTSLDSHFSPMTSRSTINESAFEQPQGMDEKRFEDVGLGDDDVKPKKKSIFARFGDTSSENPTSSTGSRPSSSHLGFRIPGRKRGHSGQGSELGSINSQIPRTGVEGTV
ncbi:hypothetical protein V8E54_014256 [Elaphomyces granulatus]